MDRGHALPSSPSRHLNFQESKKRTAVRALRRRNPRTTTFTRTLATIFDLPPRDYFGLPRIDPFQPRACLQSSSPNQPAAASSYKLPPLDFPQQQASQQYWPGANSSTPATTAQALNTLPTPPSDGNDGFKPPGQHTKSEYNSLAATAVQQPGMSSMETATTSSLTARRPAATHLPPFDLPPVPFGQQYPQKYAPLPAMNAATQQTTSSVSVGNLLTPPTTVPGEVLSPISALSGATGAQSYTNFAWPPLNMNTGLTPLGLGTGTTPQPWSNPLNTARGMFSPSIASTLAQRGTSNSPSAGDSIPPPPPYDMNSLPPIPSTTMSMSMSTPSTLAPPTAQQQAMAQAYMAQNQTQTQTPVSSTTTQASPISGTDAYSQRPQSTPSNFYSHSQPSSAQQNSFPGFNTNSSPVQQSPMSAPPQVSRISPINLQSASFSPPTSQATQFGRSTYSSYSLPAMSTAPTQLNGPIMSNIHNPGNPMGMMGMPSTGLHGGMPYHSGVAAHLNQQLYGNQQQQPHNERPFKCDQCPQSFNRNHDLKRHKRIHLAVKPFPCGHCEKSFSRKDALKVSIRHPMT